MASFPQTMLRKGTYLQCNMYVICNNVLLICSVIETQYFPI